jgi:ABC-type lipoprotein export system ATPase subunit
MTNIFEIRNLSCRYPKSTKIVLQIEDLIISKGDIVFFVGASGVGKSTILETLGLMNNTIVENTESKFLFNQAGPDSFNFLDIWKKGDGILSQLRKKHFSFIFQQTNLFSHLTAQDNTNIIQVLQGESFQQADFETRNIFKKLSLDFGKELKPKVTNISGGQRQRVAFARAICAQYDVLFADEPTGNLDWYNADNLMRNLVANVQSKNKTAIVVTHDIELAIKYSNKIVLMEKKHDEKSNTYYGYIGSNQLFNKNNDSWLNGNSKLGHRELSEIIKQKIMDQSELFNLKN